MHSNRTFRKNICISYNDHIINTLIEHQTINILAMLQHNTSIMGSIKSITGKHFGNSQNTHKSLFGVGGDLGMLPMYIITKE